MMLQGRHIVQLEQEEEKQVVAMTRRSAAKEVTKVTVEESLTPNTEEDTEAVTMKNFHGEQCRTCVRMRTIMGDILPHPVNV